ncbi:hypothetical protein GE061_001706 [Apolygus lucorum]|uniref:Protein tincar n=1 Tax=Apolygus lucorum TaxID=248454 RepID=A0A8S9Y7U1_APOLU|nr:hypothetical protein GE061_001706 [Apolygus lucorum]
MSVVERAEGGRCPPLQRPPRPPRPRGCKIHLNSLWSVWYGFAATAFQSYIAVQLSKKLLDCWELPWGLDAAPRTDLQACLILTGLAIVLLPFFFFSCLIKVGNLANDGFKLGRNLSACGVEPEDSLAGGPGGCRSLWRHGGPTGPFLHLAISFCLLLPNLLMQARLIQADFLPRDYVWKTDLDFIISSYDRLVVLSFMTPTNAAETNVSKASPPTTPMTPQNMMLTSNDYDSIYDEEKWGPVSIEFFNYALALAVYAVRYPAVFWNTNKWWGTIFSFQLFINGLQNLLVYVGICVLYKVHVIGPSEVLTSIPAKFGAGFFLLNAHVTLALLFLTVALVTSSSLVLYLYGYGRFQAFLSHEKACKLISVEGREWGYLTHCAALCVLLAITVVEGPLLIDLAVIYKASLDSSVLFSVIAAVFHLFIWVVLWLILTLKQNWIFKLRVTVGKAAVKSARSIKLLTDVELLSSCESSAPLLVVASGRTYTISDASPKKTIINAIHKAAMDRKSRLQAAANSDQKEQYDENDEQIYWLRPKPISPKNSPDSEVSDGANWQKKAVPKPKVTFDQNVKRSPRECPVQGDDGDYARLRELPLMGPSPSHMELQNKIIEKVQYMSTKTMVITANKGDYEDPNPVKIEPMLPPPPPVIVHDTPATPRCLLRADSGMPHDLTPRSESEASGSPPDHSETSSGVHSNSSRESHNNNTNNNNHNNNASNGGQAVPNGDIKPLNGKIPNGGPWANGGTLHRPITQPPPTEGEVVIRRKVEPEAIAVPSSTGMFTARKKSLKIKMDGRNSSNEPDAPTGTSR